MANVHRLTVKICLCPTLKHLTCAGALPGKSGSAVSWRNSGTCKMFQVVQLEEPYLPQSCSELACCCSSEVNSCVSGGAQHPKGGAF